MRKLKNTTREKSNKNPNQKSVAESQFAHPPRPRDMRLPAPLPPRNGLRGSQKLLIVTGDGHSIMKRSNLNGAGGVASK